jgi:glycosyltransferase involved in cell wall biosynthesis
MEDPRDRRAAAGADMASVSVVIPCYNGLPYVTEALDAARQQTHRPAEIIVVDDGSTDGSAATVQAYGRDHPGANVRLVQQANAGEPAARNTGIRASSGQWVAQLDTDDWWEHHKLERQLEEAEQAGPGCVLVHTAVMGHLPDGSTRPSDLDAAARRTGWCTQALLEPASIGHPSIMVRRTALEAIGGYDPSFRQACDIDLYFRLSAVGTFAFVPEYLLHYRYHAGQMSASQLDQIRYHHRAVRQFFDAHPDKAEQIGRDRIRRALADHVAVKLESCWWRRNLADFRGLLAYATEQQLETPRIRQWARRARLPDWLIRLKDRVAGA